MKLKHLETDGQPSKLWSRLDPDIAHRVEEHEKHMRSSSYCSPAPSPTS